MKTNVGNRVQDTSTAFASLIETFINKRYFQVLRTINWNNYRLDYTFDSISGTQDYVLPDDFGKEISARDTTNGKELSPVQFDELVRYYPDEVDASGTIERYVIYDSPVKEQPSSASVLTIVSSSASDTTQTILIRGISSAGIEIAESVTLTGTSDALTTNSFTRIKAISKSASTTGYITIDSNSAAKTQAVMAPEVLESRYKICKLHYVPNAVVTISMPYIIKPLPLIEDYDYPVIDIADLIELGAEADAWRYKRQGAKAQQLEAMFNVELQQYIFDKENQPNQITQFSPTTYDNDNLY